MPDVHYSCSWVPTTFSVTADWFEDIHVWKLDQSSTFPVWWMSDREEYFQVAFPHKIGMVMVVTGTCIVSVIIAEWTLLWI